MTSGTKRDIWLFFFSAKNQHHLTLFSLENDQILDPWQNLPIITFFAGKRYGGVCLCPKGLISTKIFALSLTVREIFVKTVFKKIEGFWKFSKIFYFLHGRYWRLIEKIWLNFFSNLFKSFSIFFLKFSKFTRNLSKNHYIFIKTFV